MRKQPDYPRAGARAGARSRCCVSVHAVNAAVTDRKKLENNVKFLVMKLDN